MTNIPHTGGDVDTRDSKEKMDKTSIDYELPHLRLLNLPERELAALRTQGFVSAERRRQNLVFKLRYRLDGRQHVRFLGDDERRAHAVRDELLLLQHDVQEKRRFTALRIRTTRVLKECKAASQGFLGETGYYFHGLAIRKRRRPKAH